MPLKYLFLTHQETPHSGGLGRLLARFPELEVVGTGSDGCVETGSLSTRIASSSELIVAAGSDSGKWRH